MTYKPYARLNVIALTGATGSGKDTLAAELVAQHGYTRLAFGDTLRDMVAQTYGVCTDERDISYCKHGSFKDAMLYHGKLLAISRPDYLSNCLLSKLSMHVATEHRPVVITDLRKPIELDILCQANDLNLYFLEVLRPSNTFSVKRLDNLLSKDGSVRHSTYEAHGLQHYTPGVIRPLAVIDNSSSAQRMVDQVASVLELCLPFRTPSSSGS